MASSNCSWHSGVGDNSDAARMGESRTKTREKVPCLQIFWARKLSPDAFLAPLGLRAPDFAHAILTSTMTNLATIRR